ncbi:MAG: hypothetical protein ABSE86_32025 [Bryobacteraceae bacterium]|jgi:hypothetical protein
MNTERLAPENVVPTAVIPIDPGALDGICDKALICDGVAITTSVLPEWSSRTVAPKWCTITGRSTEKPNGYCVASGNA